MQCSLSLIDYSTNSSDPSGFDWCEYCEIEDNYITLEFEEDVTLDE